MFTFVMVIGQSALGLRCEIGQDGDVGLRLSDASGLPRVVLDDLSRDMFQLKCLSAKHEIVTLINPFTR